VVSLGGFASEVSIGASGAKSTGRVPVFKVAQNARQGAADALEYWHKRRRGGVALMMPTVATPPALK